MSKRKAEQPLEASAKKIKPKMTIVDDSSGDDSNDALPTAAGKTFGAEQLPAFNTALDTLKTYKILGDTLKSIEFHRTANTFTDGESAVQTEIYKFTDEERAEISTIVPPSQAVAIKSALDKHKEPLQKIAKSLLHQALTCDNATKSLATVIPEIRKLADFANFANTVEKIGEKLRQNRSGSKNGKLVDQAEEGDFLPTSSDEPRPKSNRKKLKKKTPAEIEALPKTINSPEDQQRISKAIRATLESFRFKGLTNEEKKFTGEEIDRIIQLIHVDYADYINTTLINRQEKLQTMPKSFLLWVLTLHSGQTHSTKLAPVITALAKEGRLLVNQHQYALRRIKELMVSGQNGYGYFGGATTALKNELKALRIADNSESDEEKAPLPVNPTQTKRKKTRPHKTADQLELMDEYYNKGNDIQKVFAILEPVFQSLCFPGGEKFTLKEKQTISKIVPFSLSHSLAETIKEHKTNLEQMDKAFLYWVLTCFNSPNHMQDLISSVNGLATYGLSLVTTHHYDLKKMQIVMMRRQQNNRYLTGSTKSLKLESEKLNIVGNTFDILSPVLGSFCFPGDKTFTPKEIEDISNIVPFHLSSTLANELDLGKNHLQKMDKSFLFWVLTHKKTPTHMRDIIPTVRGFIRYAWRLVNQHGHDLDQIKSIMIKVGPRPFMGAADRLKQALGLLEDNIKLPPKAPTLFRKVPSSSSSSIEANEASSDSDDDTSSCNTSGREA